MYTQITVAQADGVTKAPKIEAPKPKVTRSEEPEEVELEEVEEPVKRAKKKEEPTVDSDSDSLASVIDAWSKDD